MKKQKAKKTTHDDCHRCPAACCRDLAMAIGKPSTKAEIEDLKWQVRFNTVDVFIKSHHWYLRVKGRCIYLGRRNMCKIYEKRPLKCRLHRPPDCERFGEYHEVLIKTPEQLQEYLDSKKKRKRAIEKIFDAGKKIQRIKF
ncbi:MAG: YkgJ family cysteine cluster protein [Candidatus Omnitrophica bacterium]|nr:YkgJ family cysteine cluster protein [Candidatus Omnitrophota bacterium]